jgi:serine/threonine-protein kinase
MGVWRVFYELLAGKRAFEGEDVSDTLANILKAEPAWNALPVTTPATIRMLLQGCLEKNRRDRFGDISTPRFLLKQCATGRSAPELLAPDAIPRAVPAWRRLLAMALTAVIAGATVGGIVWLLTRSVPPRVSRLTISPTGSAALTINGGASTVAITPDGSRIVYVGNRGTELFVRPLDALEPVSLFKGNPRGPFISPDGQWVGFFDATTILKRVAITGGPAVTIANLDGNSRGATWLPGDTIVFATAAPTTGLQQVAADGGAVTVLTRPDRERGNADHLWPELLADGQAVLFTILPISGRVEEAQIAVLDLKTRIQKVVMRGGSDGHYVTSGHLLYAAGNALRAVGFDPAKVEARGTSVPVAPDVFMTTIPAQGAAAAAVSSDGTLVYLRGVDKFGLIPRTLVWVDRQGRETTLGAPLRIYSHPRLSPDGGRLATWANDQDSDIWIWSLMRRTLTRLTFTVNIDNFPVWTADGQRLVFASERDGQRNSLLKRRTARVRRSV